MMAIAMMQGKHTQSKQTPEEAEEAEEKESIAVVPIAMSLLAGPGAISTVIIYADQSFHPIHLSLIIGSSLIVALLIWFSLKAAIPVSRMMSRTGITSQPD